MEIFTLTTPSPKPSQLTIIFERLIIDLPAKSVSVTWRGENGEAGSASYPTPAVLNPLAVLQPSGQQLITTLNSANMATTSLVKRTLQRLQTDGYLPAGTISGVAD